jgi:thiamine-phosphate pyrophosphorylase
LSKPVAPPAITTSQLYLVIETGETARDRLSAVLDAVPVASVLIKQPPNARPDVSAIKALVELSQQRGIAAFIDADPALARTVRADGVHLPWSPTLIAQYHEAREILGQRFMVGVEIDPKAEAARHEAMELAEAGADYVGFGPGIGTAPDSTQLDLLSWWAEIFEVPCVAFGVASGETLAAVVATHVEFIAVPLAAGLSPADCAQQVRQFADILRTPQLAGANP